MMRYRRQRGLVVVNSVGGAVEEGMVSEVNGVRIEAPLDARQ